MTVAVTCARVELGKFRSELEHVHRSNLALKRDVKSAEERSEMAQVRKAQRDAAAAKLYVKVAEIRRQFDERGEKLMAATSAVSEKAEEVKSYQAAMNRSNEKLMKGRERVDALKVTGADKTTKLAHLEVVRENVGKLITSMKAERNELARNLAHTRSNSSA